MGVDSSKIASWSGTNAQPTTFNLKTIKLANGLKLPVTISQATFNWIAWG